MSKDLWVGFVGERAVSASNEPGEPTALGKALGVRIEHHTPAVVRDASGKSLGRVAHETLADRTGALRCWSGLNASRQAAWEDVARVVRGAINSYDASAFARIKELESTIAAMKKATTASVVQDSGELELLRALEKACGYGLVSPAIYGALRNLQQHRARVANAAPKAETPEKDQATAAAPLVQGQRVQHTTTGRFGRIAKLEIGSAIVTREENNELFLARLVDLKAAPKPVPKRVYNEKMLEAVDAALHMCGAHPVLGAAFRALRKTFET